MHGEIQGMNQSRIDAMFIRKDFLQEEQMYLGVVVGSFWLLNADRSLVN